MVQLTKKLTRVGDEIWTLQSRRPLKRLRMRLGGFGTPFLALTPEQDSCPISQRLAFGMI